MSNIVTVLFFFCFQTSGVEVWRYNLEKPIFSSPSVSAYGVVVGCIDSYLYHFSHSGNLVYNIYYL